MAQRHITSGEPTQLGPLGSHFSGARTHALLKAEQLELVHLILRRGERLPLHAAPGEITLVGIEGSLQLTHDGKQSELRQGTVLHLAAGVPHTVDATEDSSALLTICLQRPSKLQPTIF